MVAMVFIVTAFSIIFSFNKIILSGDLNDSYLICGTEKPFFWIFDFSTAPPLLFYAYIPICVVSIFFGLLIFLKNKRCNYTRLFLGIVSSFSLWIINTLIQWVSSYNTIIHLAWQLDAFFEILIFLFSISFIYVFLYKKEINFWLVLILILIYLIVIILLPTEFNIYTYDIKNCEGVIGSLWYFIYLFELLSIFWIIGISLNYLQIYKDITIKEKTEIFLLTSGVCFFLGLFSLSNILGEITKIYEINLIGPLGMVVLLGVIIFLVFKFNTFNLNFYSSQIFIFVLATLIFAMILIQHINYLHYVASSTFVIVIILGFIIIRIEKNIQIANTKLQLLAKQKSALISTVTHDIGTPLTVLKCYVSMIKDERGDNVEEVKIPIKSLDIIEKTTEDLIQVVNDFMEVCNIDDKNIIYDIQETNLKLLSREIKNNLKDLLKNSSVKFSGNNISNNIKVFIDREKIIQSIKTILNNSLKYSLDGKIRLVFELSKSMFQIKIMDYGIRNFPETTETLVSKFSKSNNRFEANIISKDLSLYVTKKTIEDHKGIFSIYEKDGLTVFEIQLPIK